MIGDLTILVEKNDEEFIKTIKEIESKVHKLIEEVEAI